MEGRRSTGALGGDRPGYLECHGQRTLQRFGQGEAVRPPRARRAPLTRRSVPPRPSYASATKVHDPFGPRHGRLNFSWPRDVAIVNASQPVCHTNVFWIERCRCDCFGFFQVIKEYPFHKYLFDPARFIFDNRLAQNESSELFRALQIQTKSVPEQRLPRDVVLAIRAETLDALAGFLELRFRCRVGDTEVRAETEGRTMNDGNAFQFQQFGNEILVRLDWFAYYVSGLAENSSVSSPTVY